jgi:predicted nucleic acid-binding protein
MIFADVPPGAALFLDANPLIYYFIADPTFGPAYAQLLRRIELHDVQAFTSTHVLGEVVHALRNYPTMGTGPLKSRVPSPFSDSF